MVKFTSNVVMSIDNLYFIRVCAERISLEMKSRPVYSVSSLLRPLSKKERDRYKGGAELENTRLQANIQAFLVFLSASLPAT